MTTKTNPAILLISSIAFILLAFFAITPVTAYAHAPKEVNISYNQTSQTLTVTITHKSPLPGWHYINKVEIKKNGKVVSTNIYKKQPDQATFDYTYKIEAAAGDILEVTATCNVSGAKAAKFTVTNAIPR